MPKTSFTYAEVLEYNRRHAAVVAFAGKAQEYLCMDCGEDAKEWAIRHGFDGSELNHFQPMCHRCHQKYDDRWNDSERAKVAGSLRKYHAEMTPEQRAERGRKISEGKLRGYSARSKKRGDA